jgi:hypothetical protein
MAYTGTQMDVELKLWEPILDMPTGNIREGDI